VNNLRHPADRVQIERVDVAAYTVPTDAPESDGTLQWDKTTLVLVHITAGMWRGLGYTYADQATADLIQDTLVPEILHRNAFDIPLLWRCMVDRIRNLGRPGISSMAISAVDVALWDLKARILDVPLVSLLGTARDTITVYGSGGFCSYTAQQLEDQFLAWLEKGIHLFKMKVGRDARADTHRVRHAHEVIGPTNELMVDANGAYTRKMALLQAERFADQRVCWFEEPVSSDDLEGLRVLRNRAPAGMDIAAGEYGYDAYYFRRMIEAGSVDVLQADATRCGGVTGFLQAANLCAGWGIPLSSHTAPGIHMHLGCACDAVRHLEYFHDHERIERMFFAGNVEVTNGVLRPDLARPGLGLEFKLADAKRFAA
jgi:L-alanine-DL-glutamate epimerase-like enolase superfamily enzyme